MKNWLAGREECLGFQMRQDEILRILKKNGQSGFGIRIQPEIRRLSGLLSKLTTEDTEEIVKYHQVLRVLSQNLCDLRLSVVKTRISILSSGLKALH
jgi:hypothetical protein